MLSEFEHKRYERMVRAFIDSRRPPPHIRGQLDLGFRLSGQSVEIFELRPLYNEPSTQHEVPIAKATFVKTRSAWRIFWMRQDLKWHKYDPVAEVLSLEEFLQVVGEDAYGCFWG